MMDEQLILEHLKICNTQEKLFTLLKQLCEEESNGTESLILMNIEKIKDLQELKNTFLFWGCAKKNPSFNDVIDYFLTNGAEPNFLFQGYITSIRMLSYNNNIKMFRKLALDYNCSFDDILKEEKKEPNTFPQDIIDEGIKINKIKAIKQENLNFKQKYLNNLEHKKIKL